MTLDYRNPMQQPTGRPKVWGKVIGWSVGVLVAVLLLAIVVLSSDVFTCPSSDVHMATGAATQQVMAWMLAGDHLSYAWVGAGLKNDAPADVILAFDLERHLRKDGVTTTGINVLLADGTVEFVDEATGKTIWAQFVSGVRPVRMPTTTMPAAASTVPSP